MVIYPNAPGLPSHVRWPSRLVRLSARPDGCPWDGEQTHDSLKPMLLEETYELLDAIDGGKTEEVAEELGDVLYHLVYQTRIGAEAGEFDERMWREVYATN